MTFGLPEGFFMFLSGPVIVGLVVINGDRWSKWYDKLTNAVAIFLLVNMIFLTYRTM